MASQHPPAFPAVNEAGVMVPTVEYLTPEPLESVNEGHRFTIIG
jgi:hypothetical protein